MSDIPLPRFRAAALPLVLLALVIFPVVASDYLLDVAFFFGIYVLLGLSLNIVLEEVGLYDLGHAGFYAIGAYATAILNTRFGIPVLILLPVSVAASCPGRAGENGPLGLFIGGSICRLVSSLRL